MAEKPLAFGVSCGVRCNSKWRKVTGRVKNVGVPPEFAVAHRVPARASFQAKPR
jgi:hypothetical protein